MPENPTQSSYDTIAEEYARRMLHELDYKPFDRDLLDRFAAQVVGRGRVADVGCGPGHVARSLHERGVDACGVDLSPAMIALARQEHPALDFYAEDMRTLPFPDASLAAIVSFYALIHIPRTEIVAVLREMRRTLVPNGILLVAFHQGSEIRHFDALWEQPVSLDFIFFERDEMTAYLEEAGFTVDEVHERQPYPEEAQTERVYIFAHK